MDQLYLKRILEIDAQHQAINDLLNSLREAIPNSDKHYLIHPTLKHLKHSLTSHFAYEEALMQMVNYTELPQHRKMHEGVLKVFDDYFKYAHEPCNYEYFGKLINEKVLNHIVDHDVHMAEMIKDYLAAFQPPASTRTTAPVHS